MQKSFCCLVIFALVLGALAHKNYPEKHNSDLYPHTNCTYTASDGSFYDFSSLRATNRAPYQYLDTRNHLWTFNICGRLAETMLTGVASEVCPHRATVCVVNQNNGFAMDAGNLRRGKYSDSVYGPSQGLTITYTNRLNSYTTILELNCATSATEPWILQARTINQATTALTISSSAACPISSPVIDILPYVEDDGDSEEEEDGFPVGLLIILGVIAALIGMCVCACAGRRGMKKLRIERSKHKQQAQSEVVEPLIVHSYPSYPSPPSSNTVKDTQVAYTQLFEQMSGYPGFSQQPVSGQTQVPYGYWPMVAPNYNPHYFPASPDVQPPRSPSGFQFIPVQDVKDIPDDEQIARNLQDRINRGLE